LSTQALHEKEMDDFIIQMEDVSVSFGEVPVLDHVFFQVRRGEFLAILGPNGSGKTTLLKCILGLIRPDSGKIRIFDTEPWNLNDQRRRIGYVPQLISVDLMFPLRAKEAVLMGRYSRIGMFRRPKPTDREAARIAMERVGIADLADRPIARLSGGQRQRVFLARALASEPEILFLDEPTTGVDPTTTESFYELLGRLHREGITIIIVSHDVGVVASHVDGVACLNRGLVGHGRPEEVLGSEEMAKMYGCDVVLFHHGRLPHIVVERKDDGDS
jgi:zinc transport system ATP-binding protein